VLITGGAGFIGANLVRELAASDEGHEIVVVDDFSTGRESNLEGFVVELHRGSILDESLLEKAMPGVDSVVHLAARASVPRSIADPLATVEVNVTGTARVLEAARAAGVAHLVFASSSSVYGANPTLPKSEDMVPMPMSPYAASKLGAESLVLSYGPSFGMGVLAFRFFNVYGPLQPADHAYAAVVPRFVHAALNGQPIEIYGDGLQTRDFTFVGSVVDVLTQAAQRRISNDGPVNLAFGTRSSLLELVDLVGQIRCRTLERQYREPRLGDVKDSQANCSRLRTLFPDVHPTALAAGLRETVDWMSAAVMSGR
jgi:UDP-glucose 4-epimerase